jgi:exodeoxyribonuclease VII large subunit
VDNARDRLDRLWRLADSLHPDRPLRLGYVRVEKRGGGVVATAEVARTAGALTLHFVDGAVDVRAEKPGGARGSSSGEAVRQADLF